tara:strand:+ start:889 stop:1071 length:183 start_codon:yes stop_codon:yes gene_type:complete
MSNKLKELLKNAKNEEERVDIMDKWLLKKIEIEESEDFKKGGYIKGNKFVAKQYGGKIGK